MLDVNDSTNGSTNLVLLNVKVSFQGDLLDVKDLNLMSNPLVFLFGPFQDHFTVMCSTGSPRLVLTSFSAILTLVRFFEIPLYYSFSAIFRKFFI